MSHAAPIPVVIKALKASGGFQGPASAQLGITQSALSQRISKSKELKQALIEIHSESLDLAESELMKLIKKGNLGAICFKLKCHGKARGFIERSQIEDVTKVRAPFILQGIKNSEIT